jgi:hypothetical protein
MTRPLQQCGAVRKFSREITDAYAATLEVSFESTLITSQIIIAPLAILPSGFLFCAVANQRSAERLRRGAR